MRSVIANRLADNGKDWTEFFAMYNSGTYNNQWMVVDTKKFVTGQEVGPDTLWIIEQIPGYTQAGDVSSVLSQKQYWPSYNVPYFAEVYTRSGYNGTSRMLLDKVDVDAHSTALNGHGFAYETSPRAYIFAERHSTVKDMESLKHLMQYNQYQTDPASGRDPANSISSRYDLRTKKASPFGGLDSKVSVLQRIV